MNRTLQLQLVIRVLLGNPDAEYYVYDVARRIGSTPGVVQPIFKRMERAGWLTSRWENVDPVEVKRPRRLYYRVRNDVARREMGRMLR